ncbi:hypothetical protein ACVWW4_005991 [Bradyrhizobium sp. LB7.1]
MAQQHSEILLQPHIGAMHDQIRAEWRGPAAGLILVMAQPRLDFGEPRLKLFRATTVHSGEAADHSVTAGRDHELDARHQKHRRRDQRQIETIAKALQSIGRHKPPCHSCLLARALSFHPAFPVLALRATLARQTPMTKQ